jgi:hypothetical protein
MNGHDIRSLPAITMGVALGAGRVELAHGVNHGHDVFRRCEGLDVVDGIENKTS